MRYKGKPSEATLRREYPHAVEIVVPRGGFGTRLDTMHASLRGVAHARGRGRRDGEQDVSCWLFAQRDDAEAFARTFGGTVVED